MSFVEKSEGIPDEITTAMRNNFGYLIYSYSIKDPDKSIIYHYPEESGAFVEGTARYEWSQSGPREQNVIGYTVGFLYKNPNPEILNSINDACRNGKINDWEKETITTSSRLKIEMYNVPSFKKYRELIVLDKDISSLTLSSLKIDPNNSYNIKNFADLIEHIKKNPMDKSTGTTSRPTKISHMPLNWEKVDVFLKTYGDKTEIPGHVLYDLVDLNPSAKKSDLKAAQSREMGVKTQDTHTKTSTKDIYIKRDQLLRQINMSIYLIKNISDDTIKIYSKDMLTTPKFYINITIDSNISNEVLNSVDEKMWSLYIISLRYTDYLKKRAWSAYLIKNGYGALVQFFSPIRYLKVVAAISMIELINKSITQNAAGMVSSAVGLESSQTREDIALLRPNYTKTTTSVSSILTKHQETLLKFEDDTYGTFNKSFNPK